MNHPFAQVICEDYPFPAEEGWVCHLVAGHNKRFLYRIPSPKNRRVVKFDTDLKTLTKIGPDLGLTPFNYYNWNRGILANDGCIYCLPIESDGRFLKIDTKTDDIEILHIQLPADETPRDDTYLWTSGAIAADGNIYYMPCSAHRILKFDPRTRLASSVGPDLADEVNIDEESDDGYIDCLYDDTVLGSDGCLYGIPQQAKHVIRLDPRTQLLSVANPDFSNGKFDLNFAKMDGMGSVLHSNGIIYAFKHDEREGSLKVLKIDTDKGIYTVNSFYENLQGSAHPIIGLDNCIYLSAWSPSNSVLKYDPQENTIQNLKMFEKDGINNWASAEVASDGNVYFVSSFQNHMIQLNTLNELTDISRLPMIQSLQDLFRNDGGNTKSLFYNLVQRFGLEKVIEYLPCGREWNTNFENDIPLFLNVASIFQGETGSKKEKACTLTLVHHLLKQNVNQFVQMIGQERNGKVSQNEDVAMN